ENVCLGRNKGDKGSAFFDGKIQEYECVEAECDLSASSSCDDVELVPVSPNYSSSVANSSSSFAEQNGKTPEELANDPSSPLYLGACNAENVGKEKPFDIKNAENATTTGSMTYVCDGVKWRKLNGWDEEFGICTKSVMEQGAVKDVPGSRYMKCEYLDNENKYEWIDADSYDYYARKACHYGNVDKNLFSEDNDYICVTAKDENGKNRLDNKGNHVHEWRDATADDYCVGDRVVSTKQKVADENLGELTFNEKCKFKESLYVRNNTEEGTSEWVSNWTFVGNNRTESGYVIFMEGYTDDNEVYYCGDWCNGSSVDAVKARLAVTNSSSQQQELLNIICNMGEYNRVSAGAYAVETIAFEVEVQLSEAEIKKTYVASAKRNDWHVATLNDILGACTETVMADDSKNRQKFEDVEYKCDCEKDGDAYKSCAWVRGSATEQLLGQACTANILGTVSDSYVCLDADDGHDWQTVTAEEWCPTHGQNLTGETTSYRGICDDVPGDNTTYLLIGSASSWAQVPNTYRWNDDNITTADKKAVEAQLISGNSCTDKDIVSLLYD
ncbi:MAG: hypothetical protein II471_06580, partial [Bacteroidales bacterium]|nr:hypothetical protein [Bacteroidales bacterium]